MKRGARRQKSGLLPRKDLPGGEHCSHIHRHTSCFYQGGLRNLGEEVSGGVSPGGGTLGISLGGRKPQFVHTGPPNSEKEEEMMREGFLY